jgi:hypothetical protein
MRSGPDGADLALLDVIVGESVEERFSGVVIASGDGRFADEAARLGSLGIVVTVVSTRRSLSRRLELAAGQLVIFDEMLPPADPSVRALKAA